jgi:endonuclease/exonuclease/phosphatase family metal-dependent hydrolase
MTGMARLLVLLLVATGLVCVSGAPAATAADDQVRVGSFNVDRGRGLPAWRRAVRELRSQVDVAGLQEVSSAAKRRFLASGRWGAFGATPGPDENPVVWDRADFHRVGAEAVRIAGRQGRLPASYATVVQLDQRATGQRYAVLNVHLVWGAVEDGRKVPGHHARYRYYVAQVRGLARAVAGERRLGVSRVLVVGDFNVDHRHDRRLRHRALPAAMLGEVGLVSAWDSRGELPARGGTSTMGAGYIDNVWSSDPARAVRTLRGVSGGQHHPVVATYGATTANPAPTAP